MSTSQRTLFKPSGKPSSDEGPLDVRHMPVSVSYGIVPSNENAIALVFHCRSEDDCPVVNEALDRMRRQGFFRIRTNPQAAER